MSTTRRSFLATILAAFLAPRIARELTASLPEPVKDPYAGIQFGLDPDPLRFHEDGRHEYEYELTTQRGKGPCVRINPAWVNAPYELDYASGTIFRRNV